MERVKAWLVPATSLDRATFLEDGSSLAAQVSECDGQMLTVITMYLPATLQMDGERTKRHFPAPGIRSSPNTVRDLFKRGIGNFV